MISKIRHMYVLQAQSPENFPRNRSHWFSELGPRYLSGRCLGHLLLLHLEGSEVNRQGKTFAPMVKNIKNPIHSLKFN